MARDRRSPLLLPALAIGLVLALVLVIGVVDLTRRMAVAPAVPFGARQGLEDYRRAIEAAYGSTALVFPNPATNSLGFSAIDDPVQWQANVNACFAVNGVTGVHAGPDFTIIGVPASGSNGTDGSGFFACVVRYPSPGQLKQRLSPSQLGALYDYYVSFLEPCMLAAGYPMPVTPSRAGFVAAFQRQRPWHPFTARARDAARTGPVVPGSRLDALTRHCPPEPRWLAGMPDVVH